MEQETDIKEGVVYYFYLVKYSSRMNFLDVRGEKRFQREQKITLSTLNIDYFKALSDQSREL